jgi:hypothetical protein
VLLPVNKQQMLLEAEGIHFNAQARCDLSQYRWSPDAPEHTPETDNQPTLFQS